MTQEWQRRQAAECSCRGSDDFCPCQNVDRLQGLSAAEAASEIGRLATRITKLASVAGLYVGITIEPARDSDGTATAAACEDMPVPQDCQARAEGIAQPTPPSSPSHPESTP